MILVSNAKPAFFEAITRGRARGPRLLNGGRRQPIQLRNRNIARMAAFDPFETLAGLFWT